MTRPLPVAKDVRDLLEDLLGRTVTVSPGDPIRAADLQNLLLVSVFVDDGGQLKAVVGMDLPMAVYAGAAIGLIPAAGAQACIEGRELTQMIAENVTEVCNILSALVNHQGYPHLRMHRTYLPGQPPPAVAVGHLLALGRRLDLIIAVQGYGQGRFALTLAD
jgi:hypothetical protein